MLKLWATILVFVPSIAFAQTPTPSAPTGSPRLGSDCTPFYPTAAAKINAQGVVGVFVHVAVDGAVQSPRIAWSSGNADLDNAAIACVTGVHVTPIKKDGVAIEADTQIRVVWQRSYFSSAPGPSRDNVCRTPYPPLAMRLEHEGTTVLSYTIAEDGTVKNAAVTQSSGFKELDQASLDCLATFHFLPVMQNGQRIAVDSTMKTVWRLTGK